MGQNLKDKTSYEAAYWDSRTGGVKRHLLQRRWYNYVNRCLWKRILEKVGDFKGRQVLFVGCGESSFAAREMAQKGADVWCVDVSCQSLNQLMKHPFGEFKSMIHPVVMDAQRMSFQADSFDVVLGKAVVHHLDIKIFMTELLRVCTPGARIVFSEPLETNPFINLFRRLTPKLRVPTEHPLKIRDIKTITGYCRSSGLNFSECLSLASYPWFLLGLERTGGFFHRILTKVDLCLFRLIPPLKWLAWIVMIEGYLTENAQEREK